MVGTDATGYKLGVTEGNEPVTGIYQSCPADEVPAGPNRSAMATRDRSNGATGLGLLGLIVYETPTGRSPSSNP